MRFQKLMELLNADVLTKYDGQDFECKCACSSDLMSDVLAFSKEKTILLTGLNNIQVIRTAEMMDIKVVVFVRGKKPAQELIDYADSKDIILIATDNAMYEASGILYSNGLGVTKNESSL